MNIKTFILLISLSISISACMTATGPDFYLEENANPKKGVIYVYRPNNFYGNYLSPTFSVNKTSCYKLVNGSYHRIVVEPGVQTISTRPIYQGDYLWPEKSITIKLTENETRFVKFKITKGQNSIFDFPQQYVEVGQKDAIEEITKTKQHIASECE